MPGRDSQRARLRRAWGAPVAVDEPAAIPEHETDARPGTESAPDGQAGSGDRAGSRRVPTIHHEAFVWLALKTEEQFVAEAESENADLDVLLRSQQSQTGLLKGWIEEHAPCGLTEQKLWASMVRRSQGFESDIERIRDMRCHEREARRNRVLTERISVWADLFQVKVGEAELRKVEADAHLHPEEGKTWERRFERTRIRSASGEELGLERTTKPLSADEVVAALPAASRVAGLAKDGFYLPPNPSVAVLAWLMRTFGILRVLDGIAVSRARWKRLGLREVAGPRFGPL